jgi:internalin A
MLFNSFVDWCTRLECLGREARYTIEVLLRLAGTYDAVTAEKTLFAMTELDLSCSDISDVRVLGLLTNLTKLDLSDNKISDVSPLASLTNLTTLCLSENEIADISALQSLTRLTRLTLFNNEISDTSSLASLTNLTVLELGANQISNIDPLASLISLTNLELYRNEITDITSLGSLTNLVELHLFENRITDITPFDSLIKVETLDIRNNWIADISALHPLTSLTELDISRNHITDISALRSLVSIKKLDVQGNPIRALDISDFLSKKYLTFSTAPIDTKKAIEAVLGIYAVFGIKQPEVIVCRSPRDAYIQLSNYVKCKNSKNYLEARRLLGEAINWTRLSTPIIEKFANSIVWNEELADIKKQFESSNNILGLLLYELVSDDEITVCKKGEKPPIPIMLMTSLETTFIEEIYLTELYIFSINFDSSKKTQKMLSCQKQISENCGFILSFENICAICDRPRHWRFDSQNRLHGEGVPAIEFSDGWKFYLHHGVRLPEAYGKVHPNQWQPQWLLEEKNAGLRRILIEGIGYDRICQELETKEIDSWREYVLLRIDDADLEPICLLKMTCPSTGFIHALRVPPDMKSARKAISWVNWGVDPEQFTVQT